MTRIMEDYCTHCDSEIHKTQEEYHEKRSAKLFDNRVARISRGYKEIKAIIKMQIKRTLEFSGWTKVEIAMKLEKIEEEIANRLSEEDERNLGAFSGFMESVTELTNQPNSQKAIEDLFATVAPPQPLIEVSNEPVVIEKVVEEPIEVEQADTIIQQIVSSLEDMGEKTEIKEQVDQISKLRNEFNNFRALIQQQVLSHTPGSGEVRLEFLDDVQTSTAKVDGKFLKYSSSDGKFIGDDPSVSSLAITALDIDGGTDIGAAIVDADLFIVDDGTSDTIAVLASHGITLVGQG